MENTYYGEKRRKTEHIYKMENGIFLNPFFLCQLDWIKPKKPFHAIFPLYTHRY
jgi:hypothetical protein